MIAHQEVARALRRGLLLAALLSCAPALAQEFEIGSGVVCDRIEQAERYIALFNGNTDETLTQINTEANSNDACAVVSVAFVRGRKVSKVTNDQGTFEVVRILIVGLTTRNGIQSTSPFVQFTLFKIDERVA
jgi:hypothetical protein